MRCPHTVNVNYRWNEKKCSLGTPEWRKGKDYLNALRSPLFPLNVNVDHELFSKDWFVLFRCFHFLDGKLPGAYLSGFFRLCLSFTMAPLSLIKEWLSVCPFSFNLAWAEVVTARQFNTHLCIQNDIDVLETLKWWLHNGVTFRVALTPHSDTLLTVNSTLIACG